MKESQFSEFDGLGLASRSMYISTSPGHTELEIVTYASFSGKKSPEIFLLLHILKGL